MTHETSPSPAMLQHLFLTPDRQSEEWKKREADRRAGRGRKDWWKKVAPDATVSHVRAPDSTRKE